MSIFHDIQTAIFP